MKSEFVGDLGNGHGIGQILFVAQNKKCCISEFVFSQDFLELEGSFVDSLTIIAVHNKNDSLGVVVIVPPQGSNFVLTSNVPNCEA